MPYCEKCGGEMPEGATYCPKCGASVKGAEMIRLATWGERFVAWLIDIVILSVMILPLKAFVQFALPSFVWTSSLPSWVPFVDFGFSNVIYFLYWVILEGMHGQSFGKMIMRIKATRTDGKPMDMGQVSIESVGKAFLLPLDCLLGWILYPRRNQRLFNHISNTTVIRARK